MYQIPHQANKFGDTGCLEGVTSKFDILGLKVIVTMIQQNSVTAFVEGLFLY